MYCNSFTKVVTFHKVKGHYSTSTYYNYNYEVKGYYT